MTLFGLFKRSPNFKKTCIFIFFFSSIEPTRQWYVSITIITHQNRHFSKNVLSFFSLMLHWAVPNYASMTKTDKHNAELWSTAPDAKDYCRKFSYGQKSKLNKIFHDIVLKMIFSKKMDSWVTSSSFTDIKYPKNAPNTHKTVKNPNKKKNCVSWFSTKNHIFKILSSYAKNYVQHGEKIDEIDNNSKKWPLNSKRWKFTLYVWSFDTFYTSLSYYNIISLSIHLAWSVVLQLSAQRPSTSVFGTSFLVRLPLS